MDNRAAPQSPKFARLRMAILALFALPIVGWIATILAPLLPPPLYHEVRGALHVAGEVMALLFLVGVVALVLWVKPRWSPVTAQTLREAEERERERDRKAAPTQFVTQVVALFMFGVTIAILYLLKCSGVVTDRRALYACGLAILLALFLLPVGFVIWARRARRGG